MRGCKSPCSHTAWVAMGAASAILVSDPALKGTDALGTAKVLAAAIARKSPDLVLAATESSDGYTGTVPAQIAELLGLPSVTFAKSVAIEGGVAKVQRQTEAGYDEVECPLPALVSVTAGVVGPRCTGIAGAAAETMRPHWPNWLRSRLWLHCTMVDRLPPQL